MHLRRARAPFVALVGCCVWTAPQAAEAACQDVAAAAGHAKRGHVLRRSGAVVEATKEFEAAYRCMPRDSEHDARWEHLAALLDVLPAIPVGERRGDLLCRIRNLTRDFTDTIRDVSPRPDAAAFAEEALRSVENELTSSGKACSEAPPAPTDSTTPQRARSGEESTRADTSKPVEPPYVGKKNTLKITGIAAGATAVIPLAVMIAGLVRGGRAERDSAMAKADGDLFKIGDQLHPTGAVANRMAVAGAIISGALVITSAALLVSSRRGSKLRGSARLVATGGGLEIRF